VGELNQIAGFRCVEPGGAFYAFPNIEGTGYSSRQLETLLLEQAGVAVLSGTAFASTATAICASPTPIRSRTSGWPCSASGPRWRPIRHQKLHNEMA
jgi:hypothetical protein